MTRQDLQGNQVGLLITLQRGMKKQQKHGRALGC